MKTVTNPELIDCLNKHAPPSVAVILVKLELIRTETGFKEKVLEFHTLPEGLNEFLKIFNIDLLADKKETSE